MIYGSLLPFVPKLGAEITTTTSSVEKTGFTAGNNYAITNIGDNVAFVNVENAAATTACIPIMPGVTMAKITFPYTSIFTIGLVATDLVVNEIVETDEYRKA